MTPRDFKNSYDKLHDNYVKNDNRDKAIEIANEYAKTADEQCHFSSDYVRFDVAYKYLLAGDIAAKHQKKDEKLINNSTASQLYHYAGHQFRHVEEYNTAAKTYHKAGEVSLAEVPIDWDWAIRSFARAKVCFQDIGDSEEASKSYKKEQDCIRRKFLKKKKIVSFIWSTLRKLTTNYGESTLHWAVSFILIICLFGFLYMHFGAQKKWVEGLNLNKFHNGMYLYVVTTLGFGEVIKNVPAEAKLIFILNLLTGYIMLALGIDILIRKFKES